MSLGVVFFTLLTLYAPARGVLLPNQIQNLDPNGKAQTLGVIYAITSVFSTLTTPIAGALSDRRIPLAYSTGGSAIIIVCFAFVALNRSRAWQWTLPRRSV